MATRFTRVTVVADDRQVDVSLPAGTAIGEQLPMVLRLLSVPPTAAPRGWALSTPELGRVPIDSTLDGIGVLDGTVLFLTPASEAAAQPFVDDVEETTAELVAADVPLFSGADRASAVAGVLGLLFLGTVVISALAPAPASWIGAALAGMAALAVGALVPGRGGSFAAAMAAPAGAVVVLGAGERTAVDLFAAVAGGGAGVGQTPGGPVGLSATQLMFVVLAATLGLAGAGLARGRTGMTVGGITAAVLAAIGLIAVAAGAPGYRMAAIVGLVCVVLTGFAGQLALGGAGLVNLMTADERGERVPRATVVKAVERGQAIATGVVWAVAVFGAVCAWMLLRTKLSGSVGWAPPVFGGVLALALAARSRVFTRVRQVAPLLGAGVFGALAAATMLPQWLGTESASAAAISTLGILALIGIVVAGTGFSSLAEIPRVRMQRFLDAVEFILVLALIPLLLMVFDTIGALHRLLT